MTPNIKKAKKLGGLVALTIAMASPVMAQDSLLNREGVESQILRNYQIAHDNVSAAIPFCEDIALQKYRGNIPERLTNYLDSVRNGLDGGTYPTIEEAQPLRDMMDRLVARGVQRQQLFACEVIDEQVPNVLIASNHFAGFGDYGHEHSRIIPRSQ